MGSIASSNKASQTTQNQQVGIQGTAASGAGANTGKGAVQSVGGGISLVFNTGNNKIAATSNVGNSSPKKSKVKSTGTATATATNTTSPAAPAGSSNSASNQAGGNIAVQIQQTDQGAVQAGTSVSLAALQLAASANDALLQSNTNAATLAEAALQTGADVAAVAIPTYAASEIASNPINPPTIIQTGSADNGIPPSTPNWGMILSVVGIGLSLVVIFGKKN